MRFIHFEQNHDNNVLMCINVIIDEQMKIIRIIKDFMLQTRLIATKAAQSNFGF